MDRAKLREASDVLNEAAESVQGTTGDRLREQAEQLADLATRTHGPDHGRIARVQQKLTDIEADEPAAADAIDEAYELLNEYRETVEGV